LVSLEPGSKGICLLDESKNNSDKYKRKMRNNNLNYNTIQRRKESMRKRNNYILNVEKENNYITQKENTLSDYDSKTVYTKFRNKFD
jgi:hypothetical protein